MNVLLIGEMNAIREQSGALDCHVAALLAMTKSRLKDTLIRFVIASPIRGVAIQTFHRRKRQCAES